MSRATVTGTGLTAGQEITFILYPPGINALAANGASFPTHVKTFVKGDGTFSVQLEETDTMSPSLAWAMFEGEIQFDATPVTYLQFGSGGGAYGSLEVGAPAAPTVQGPVQRLIAGTGLAVTNAGQGVISLSFVPAASGPITVKVPLVASDAAGGIIAWQAPVDAVITRFYTDITTIATGACTADFGVTAVSAGTTSATLADGIDLHTTGTKDGFDGDVAKTRPDLARISAGKWVTGSMATGATAGVVGNAYITYIPV